jgi:hypothetical protein
MKARTSASVVALVTALGVGAATVAPVASAREAAPGGAKVITSGLDDPFGLQTVGRRGFVVAENVSGQVTRVSGTGRQHVIIRGAAGVAGVATSHRRVFAVLGVPNESGPAPASRFPASSVIRSTYQGRHVRVIANLLTYELRHNPDGQRQFVNGKPVDALSNPFSMNKSRYGLLVADGGANDVLKVNPRTGHVSTFFVPPTVKDVPACLQPGAQANPGTRGCDPVPTRIAVARHSVYVSTLGAEVPGAGRVYRLDPRTGRVLHVWKGLTAPTGVAVTSTGTIFVSHVLYGAPAGDGPPPPGFDPSKVGQITRIRHGHRTHAQVTMPTGLDLRHGNLYSSAWSIASFVGIQHAGQIVRVPRSLFH